MVLKIDYDIQLQKITYGVILWYHKNYVTEKCYGKNSLYVTVSFCDVIKMTSQNFSKLYYGKTTAILIVCINSTN